MRILINDREVVIPSSLAEFTLGQRIDFHNQYGKQLDEWFQSILLMEDETSRELELMDYNMAKMFRTFAFFADRTPDDLQESEFVDDIAAIYYASLAQLFENETEITIKESYHWRGENWVLHPPALQQGSKLTFGEFIDSKQIIKHLSDLGAGKWEAMQYLCAIYLRREQEPYDDSFLYDNSPRLQLMRELPLDIVLSVGFFLTSSMSLYQATSQSSQNPELSHPENTQTIISPFGAG